jgi:hypothetical protein
VLPHPNKRALRRHNDDRKLPLSLHPQPQKHRHRLAAPSLFKSDQTALAIAIVITKWSAIANQLSRFHEHGVLQRRTRTPQVAAAIAPKPLLRRSYQSHQIQPILLNLSQRMSTP